jgi:hypothetical protein
VTTKLYRVGEAAVTVADPEAPLRKTRVRVQGQQRALDGTLNSLFVANKWRWVLEWKGLSSAAFTTLWTELDRQQSMTFVAPDGATTYTVVVVGEPQVLVDGFGHYHVVATLEEV